MKLMKTNEFGKKDAPVCRMLVEKKEVIHPEIQSDLNTIKTQFKWTKDWIKIEIVDAFSCKDDDWDLVWWVSCFGRGTWFIKGLPAKQKSL